MIKGYYERIARFLRHYVGTPTGAPILADPGCIRSAIGVLLRRGWTREQIMREALRQQDVIIRDDLFPEEVRND